jgi:sugar lactone lactonase YvrE
MDMELIADGLQVPQGPIAMSDGSVVLVEIQRRPHRIRPGRRDRAPRLPRPHCTNICIGGQDMRDARITASGTGGPYRRRWPRPGLKLNFNA